MNSKENDMKRFTRHLSQALCLLALNASCAIAADPSAPAKMPANLGDRPLATLSPPGDWKKNWTADNGNGTYSNPLFYEEFEDPDVIRVGDTYYLAGTTMHMMPAVQLMESKDLVNWKLAGYCMDKLDLGPQYRLEGGRGIYGAGIWAPCIRHHDGMFYVFCNVNGAGLQVFRSKSIYGPWERNQLPGKHDMSVLFDDDLHKVFLIYGNSAPYNIDELAPDLRSVAVPNAHKLAPQGARMGEGHHLYKIKGTYYDLSAIPGGAVNQMVAKAPTLDGPWTVTTMVDAESLGISANPARTSPADKGVWIHQGGMVDTPSGEWWCTIMSDHGSAGRMVNLVPITWDNGFPLIGLPGNLRKAPNTWIKPDTGFTQYPAPANVRDDKFDHANLNPNWQWNHVEDDTQWSLSEKPGVLRLHSLSAANFYQARNTLCSRPPGPESIMTVELNSTGLVAGDTAGLGLLSTPYAWIGIVKTADGTSLQMFQGAAGGRGGRSARGRGGAPPASAPATAPASPPAIPAGSVINPPPHLWLRVHCNFDTDQAVFSYSTDGKQFTNLGPPFTTTFQLTTFQGVRPGLFNYNTLGQPGGYADFDNYTVDEPRARGIEREIPAGKTITLRSGADGSFLAQDGNSIVNTPGEANPLPSNYKFQVMDVGLGRVALKTGNGKFLSADKENIILKDVRELENAKPGDAETFQWVNLMRGDTMLMSLTNHRYLAAKLNASGPVTVTAFGATAARKSGAEFKWQAVE
jgi:beta-xylosidase